METLLILFPGGEIKKLTAKQKSKHIYITTFISDICGNEFKIVNKYTIYNTSLIDTVKNLKIEYLAQNCGLLSPKITLPLPYYKQFWHGFNDALYKRVQIARFNAINV